MLFLLEVLLQRLILLWCQILLLGDLNGYDLGHLFLLHVVLRWITVGTATFVPGIILTASCQQSFVTGELCYEGFPCVLLEFCTDVALIKDDLRLLLFDT